MIISAEWYCDMCGGSNKDVWGYKDCVHCLLKGKEEVIADLMSDLRAAPEGQNMWMKAPPAEDGWYWRRWRVNDHVRHKEVVFIAGGEAIFAGTEGVGLVNQMNDSEWWSDPISAPDKQSND